MLKCRALMWAIRRALPTCACVPVAFGCNLSSHPIVVCDMAEEKRTPFDTTCLHARRPRIFDVYVPSLVHEAAIAKGSCGIHTSTDGVEAYQ